MPERDHPSPNATRPARRTGVAAGAMLSIMRWLWVACALGGCTGGCGGSHTVASNVDDGSAGPGGDGSTVARPVCGGSITAEATCTGVDQLTLFNPQVKNDAGGPISAGQSGTIEITVTNNGTQIVPYPCIGFAADDARVSFTDTNPVFMRRYALTLSTSLSVSLGAQWGVSIPPGTVVHLTAWADVLHGGCTQGAELHWDVTVQ